jgi:hypothetical protein
MMLISALQRSRKELSKAMVEECEDLDRVIFEMTTKVSNTGQY